MKQKKLRSLSAVLLIGWCLIFLRCETTEKSMVRALYLAQKEQSITVGLLYQAPEAAADASEASGAVQLQLAQADTLAKALAAAQKQLPQKADYRLCDYLLIDQDASAELLAAYERTVLENRQGRVSAKVSVLEMDDGFWRNFQRKSRNFRTNCLSCSSSAQTRCRGFTSIRTECFCRSCGQRNRKWHLQIQASSGEWKTALSWRPDRRKQRGFCWKWAACILSGWKVSR